MFSTSNAPKADTPAQMEADIYRAQIEDEKNIKKVKNILKDVRKNMWAKIKIFLDNVDKTE